MSIQTDALRRHKQKLDALQPGSKKLKVGQSYLLEVDKSQISGTLDWILTCFCERQGRLPRGQAFLRLAKLNGWVITGWIRSSNTKFKESRCE